MHERREEGREYAEGEWVTVSTFQIKLPFFWWVKYGGNKLQLMP